MNLDELAQQGLQKLWSAVGAKRPVAKPKFKSSMEYDPTLQDLGDIPIHKQPSSQQILDTLKHSEDNRYGGASPYPIAPVMDFGGPLDPLFKSIMKLWRAK